MNDYDMEISDDKIKESIINDNLNRNSKLNKFIELLNALNKNRIISIDGKWGSGKTIFLKQLEYINKYHFDINGRFNEENIQQFRNEYIIYYYNAWENDFHASPLLSLIYNLINDFYGEKYKIIPENKELPSDITELLKIITNSFINLEAITSYKSLADEIYTATEKREALNNLINDIIPEDRRLIFIVDELDRCRPDYAINMLEVIKHFYTNDKIIFILGTNNQQLSYTISNYYGNYFDGYGYLNKIYNMVIELGNISPKKYLDSIAKRDKGSKWYKEALYSVCEYFNFSMREINRILNDYDLIIDYFNSSYISSYSEDSIVKFLFLPYCLGLKINSRDKLSYFLDGNGYELFENFIFTNSDMTNILKRCYRDQRSNANEDEQKGMKELLKRKYNNYFVDKTADWEIVEIKNKFSDVFSLLSNYSRISTKD